MDKPARDARNAPHATRSYPGASPTRSNTTIEGPTPRRTDIAPPTTSYFFRSK